MSAGSGMSNWANTPEAPKKVIKVISENQKNVVINNVVQALRKLKSRGDALAMVISDQRMPGMLGVEVLAPYAAVVYNSHLPFSFNDGALWAGRGWNSRLIAGVRASLGPVRP